MKKITKIVLSFLLFFPLVVFFLKSLLRLWSLFLLPEHVAWSFIFLFLLFFHVLFSRSYNACLFVFILAHINQNLTLFFRSFKAATFIYHRCFLRFVFCVSVLYFMHFYFLACLIMVMVFLCLATHNALFFLIAWSFIVISSWFPESRSCVLS
jgi:hypothetical protein